jgi:predicted  nucleic acid-binding Zn-ribbon protein
MPSHNRLEKLQEEVIDIQLRIRDLEEQRLQLRKQLNGKLTMLLNFRKLLKQVRPIGSFSS